MAGGQGPLARLFGSLANVLLDVGLPTMRAWLRDRLGPEADVAQVTTEPGGFVHCDGVRLPIGPRGVLSLDRATAKIAAARGIGVDVRLHAFHGVLAFGGDSFVAEVEFASAPDPEEDAWIAGELTIKRARWGDDPEMHGRARLVVTSTDARLTGGELFGREARVRFEGEGSVEGGHAAQEAVRSATLALDNAFVGPFVDAVQAILGRAIVVPPGVPLDAQLTGEISWRAADGGTCNLHISAEGLRLDIDAKVAASGKDLLARVTGEAAPAIAMARAGVAAHLRPRDEDVITIAIDATGEAARPVVNGKLAAPELGFRFGRPRYQPAILAKDVVVDVDVATSEETIVRATASAQLVTSSGAPGTVAIDAELPSKRAAARRIVLRMNDVDAPWIAAIAAAAGVPLGLESEIEGRVRMPTVTEREALAKDPTAPATTPGVATARFFVPRDARASGTASVGSVRGHVSVTGSATVITPRSRVSVDPYVVDGDGVHDTRIIGELAFADALTVGIFPFDVRPTAGGSARVDLTLAGAPLALTLKGRVASPAVAVEIATRPDVRPFRFTDVDTTITVSPNAFEYRDGRFSGYGGSFRLEGIVPFDAAAQPDAARLAAHVKDADASFVEAAASIARGGVRIRVEHGGKRENEIHVPLAARVSGTLTLLSAGRLASSLALETAAGTALVATIALSSDAKLDGTSIRGALAVTDALVIAGANALLPDGVLRLDAQLTGAAGDSLVSGFVTSDRLFVAPGERSPIFVVTDASALFRLDARRFVWHRLEGRAYGGTVASAGLVGFRGNQAFVGLQATLSIRDAIVDDLPLDRAEAPRRACDVVRGRLAIEMRLDSRGDGPIGARGTARLDDGAFPALGQARAQLSRYGLPPPPEQAIAPATVSIDRMPTGWFFHEIDAQVRGCAATGRVRVDDAGALDGDIVVTLGEEYLRSSAVLVVPRVLTEHLTLPVHLRGAVGKPEIDADLAACLGRFVVDNRVTGFVTGVVDDVTNMITGRGALHDPPPPPPPEPQPIDEDALMRELIAKGADWDEIEERLEEHRRKASRYRIG
jgi:hypothetical protein